MREAHDHHRVTPEGRALGEQTARLADAECAVLALAGEPDERCKTCAFRAGTVPNGCLQTQADAFKAVSEDVPFMCHQHQDARGRYDRICYGWFAVRRIADRAEAAGKKLPACPYDFSAPDEA
ncbi:MAG TPA: hypothetical protein VNM71_05580 [Steroidobacteraceae bacterium]|nr:hypothetical protein [Steroidobacteraceae bacterium]